MANRSKLLKLVVQNIGCIGPDGVEVALDDVVCLVGKNNAGKSTILRAYELAESPNKFSVARDRCRWAPDGEPCVVELDVHIPEGIANIAEDWKIIDGSDRILRSRWEWAADGAMVRKTWSPAENNWSEDGKAGGADNVFKSRLPRPLRIGSLEDADKTEELLLTLALSPFVAEMKTEQGDPNSNLSKSVASLMSVVDGLSKTHEDRFGDIATKVHEGFKGVFPTLGVRLEVAMSAPTISLDKLLKEGSGIRVQDGQVETSLAQQGAGARRALFWSMLQVHNQLTRQQEVRDGILKDLKNKKEEVKAAAIAKLEALDAGEQLAGAEDDPAFPGYLLLIDEPENALHPMAARAAQKHLYQLAADPDWQVMMTTHSPYFINPLEDHTTIVRLERAGGDQGPLNSRTYRADEVTFDPETKRNLSALQQMDVGFSEIFFGSYPILVEGDTEHAAFIAAVVETNHELAARAAVIRARGKGILPGLIRMLRHFRIPFSIIHDIDWPYTSNRKANPMWTTNQTILDELKACRAANIVVRHRCSVPDFERHLGGDELGKDKPLQAYIRIKEDETLRQQVLDFMLDVCDSPYHYGLDFDPSGDQDYRTFLQGELSTWCGANGASDDPRLVGPIAG
ncbi:Predicted ATP-dependent endonuclease of the OLD family, contains P-loop ATPase and TOPRIM domains [Sphingopyxis sp. YR583]|uniref:ATP-dependent nuclease n=1 Tax=Sphingopyxis sp. YR583 TaxID=1881047 RepID=UPI0008A766B4|nr:AAA family ATPase [Sphingopyxis sp. YR583]SEH15077.1 Predicted ATP-dependent endonuclease of the OLD family, contains P-loop ATPase and TOPRIM domains [Sphingopyxis sp. YR583]